MIPYITVEFNYMETTATIFIIPDGQNQHYQENFFDNAPVSWVAIAVDTNSAFAGSDTEIDYGINILISDKLEYSEVVCQM